MLGILTRVSSVIGLVQQSTADDPHVAVIERRESQPHLLMWRVQRRRRLLVQTQLCRVPCRLLQQRPHLGRRAHPDCIRSQTEQRPCALPSASAHTREKRTTHTTHTSQESTADSNPLAHCTPSKSTSHPSLVTSPPIPGALPSSIPCSHSLLI